MSSLKHFLLVSLPALSTAESLSPKIRTIQIIITESFKTSRKILMFTLVLTAASATHLIIWRTSKPMWIRNIKSIMTIFKQTKRAGTNGGRKAWIGNFLGSSDWKLNMIILQPHKRVGEKVNWRTCWKRAKQLKSWTMPCTWKKFVNLILRKPNKILTQLCCKREFVIQVNFPHRIFNSGRS